MIRRLGNLLPLFVGLAAAAVTVVLSPKQASRDFFDVSAQVLVVLLLAVALQTRLLVLRDPAPSFSIARRFFVGRPGKEDPRMEASYGFVALLGRFLYRQVTFMGVYALALGEFSALRVLLVGSATAIADPRVVVGAIAYAVAALLTTAMLAEPLVSHEDADLDKLQRLVGLRDAGALTPEEFTAEKARVMGDR